MNISTKEETAAIERGAQAIDLATREYFARGARLKRALLIAMTYHGLAEWRCRDRARIEIIEGATRREVDLLATQSIAIAIDGCVVWSLAIDCTTANVVRMHSEQWHGRCAALNAPIETVKIGTLAP